MVGWECLTNPREASGLDPEAVHETFAAVDPTGIDSNPFLSATSQFLERSLGLSLYRPDEQLHDDIAAMLNDFSDDLAGEPIGVVDATPAHQKTLYFFLITSRGYYAAAHIQFQPTVEAVDALYQLYDRVRTQEMYLRRPETVFE